MQQLGIRAICRQAPATPRAPSRKQECSFLRDVKHFRAVDAAIVQRLLHDQPKGEWRGAQQRGFAASRFVSRLTQLHITQDFSGALEVLVAMPKT